MLNFVFYIYYVKNCNSLFIYKSFRDVIFIPFSASSQNLETLDKKEKNFKKEYLANKKSILSEIKNISAIFLKDFF